MNTKSDQATTEKPFHESIIDALENCQKPDTFAGFCKFISQTKIPKNHETIIHVIEVKTAEFSDFPSAVEAGLFALAKLKKSISPKEESTLESGWLDG